MELRHCDGDAIPDEHEMSTHKGCTCVPVPAQGRIRP